MLVMLFHVRRSFIACATLVALGLGAAADAGGVVAVDWRRSFDAARREAAATDGTLLLVVESPGCGWCQKLERTTLRDPEAVGAINALTIPVRIDASDPNNERLVAELRVEGVPLVALLDRDGRLIGQSSGYLDPRRFAAWLRSRIRPGV
jgi:thioredoxin-related protein